ncbi:MAG: metal transporter [Chloroflexi bacterium]|nr:MAG: metal transporter [Chloroflexota bacterium]
MTTNENTQSRFPLWLIAIGPLVLLAALVVLFINTNPIQVATADLPPIEDLSIQRITLPDFGVIELEVTNAGPDPVEIAQVLVDEAYWQFEIEPASTLNRLQTATITVNYPWVETEPHEIVLVTSTGATFAGEIELAVETPAPGVNQLFGYALVGVYVGIIPVGLGLLWFPAMRQLGRKGLGFILSLTVGLLVFLLIDTLLEAFEVAELLPEVYQGIPLTLFVASLTWFAIMAIGSRQAVADRESAQGRRFIALLIAIGIGFHNLGEGLVVGAAFALGEAALGSFLVIGFILHNITEGVGIAAPVTKDKVPISWFLRMLLIAGAPAIAGTLIGGFAFSPLLAVIFLGIGVGAIWQVIVEVGMLLQRQAERDGENFISWTNSAGLALGIAIMYLTAFLVKF